MTPLKRDESAYRYALTRATGVLGGEGTVLFLMLNPSTADEREDDPTIRRCVGFARQWGYARLLVGNLYAFRSTDPRRLMHADDAIGPENDEHLIGLAQRALEVIVAWGATPHPGGEDRVATVLELLNYRAGHRSPNCLGQTKDLHPRHPLYVKRDARRVPFTRYARMAA